MRRLFCGAVLVLLLSSAVAYASHYPLESVVWLEPSEVAQLQAVGIQDTESLLTAALSPGDRASLASRSGLSQERVNELAKRSDLLQVPGVGPDLVEALRRAGVQSIDSFRQLEPSALREQLAAVWGELGRDQDQLPPVDSLSYWMDAAQRVPLTLVP